MFVFYCIPINWRGLHCGDVKVRSVLEKLAEFISSLTCVEQCPEAISVFSEYAYLVIDRFVIILICQCSNISSLTFI